MTKKLSWGHFHLSTGGELFDSVAIQRLCSVAKFPTCETGLNRLGLGERALQPEELRKAY